MNFVYVITNGSYSDYHIVAVFLKEEAAEKALAEFQSEYGDHQLEVYAVYDEAEAAFAQEPMPYWSTCLNLKTGDVQWAREDEPNFSNYGTHTFHGERDRNLFWWSGHARDEQHAVKISGEKMAEWKVANG